MPKLTSKLEWRENLYKILYFYNKDWNKTHIPPIIVGCIDAAYVAGLDNSGYRLTRRILEKLLADSQSKESSKEVRHLIKEVILKLGKE